MRAPSVMRLVLLSVPLFSTPAWAIERCSFQGKPINLDNGSSTANLTGTVRCVDEDTKKETHTVSFKNGKQDGWEVRRWSDGRAVEQEYKAGKRHGGFKRHEDGRLVETSHYVDDNEQGESLRYHPNGKVSRRMDRQPEDEKSTYEDYDENGRLTKAGCGLRSSWEAGLKDCVWKGPSPLVFFHPNGQKRAVIPLKNGRREGVTELFDKEGQRTATNAYSAGVLDGVSTRYAAGKALTSTTWAQGQREGDETEFFNDGGKKQVVTWKNRQQVKRVEYFQNGERKHELVVTGDRAVESYFEDDGSLRERRNLLKGDFHNGFDSDGVAEAFFPDGGTERREHYVKGKAEGRRQVWAENGTLVEDSQWTKDRVTTRKRWNPDGGLVEDEAFYEDGSRKKK
ncbi:hypothetical protein D7X30_15230 [Corallococcus sp. AB011P]|uniref:toxin-antitoxin system YwqK family antitoxin n=1 Tax=unclassified Corallococcus TaxID=2685029 RepID=UPI000EA2E50D|nr:MULTISPECIES: hypothetical protein [unclassified Corallococcus]RKG58921.1 hypothetical protein D7X30_15230 [Corallococcus sp. AB011P]RKH87457.1 hypothetical protein D7Y21_18980 [Corallococcus sp. AB045]